MSRKRLSNLSLVAPARIVGLPFASTPDQPLRFDDVGTGAGKVAAGDDVGLVGNEKTANKNTPGGYAGLSAGLLSLASIPLARLMRLLGRFGSGRDGPITISTPYSMTRDMHWTDVTFSGTGCIIANSFKPFARGIVSGTTSAPTLIKSSIAEPGIAGQGGLGGLGSGGGGGTLIPSATMGGSAIGGQTGGAGGGIGIAGASAPAISAAVSGHGGSGGQGGSGGASDVAAGGNSGAGSSAAFSPDAAASWTVEAPDQSWLRGAVLMLGGGGGRGGAGGAGSAAGSGGGGGGGGSGGPVLDASFFQIDLTGFSPSMTVMSAKGGNGGNANSSAVGGAGGGGGGGGGGCLRLVVGSIVGTNVDALQADGGAGGNGGSSLGGVGVGGGGGRGGNPGRVTFWNLSVSPLPVSGPRTASGLPTPAVGNAGGSGSLGGTCRLSLP